MLLQHEIDAIADRLIEHLVPVLAERLGGPIQAIIKKEMKAMTDQAISDLDQATAGVLAELGLLVTALQADALALSQNPNLDPSIEADVTKLVNGTKAAAAAVAALQAAPAGSPAASPSPASPAPQAAALKA